VWRAAHPARGEAAAGSVVDAEARVGAAYAGTEAGTDRIDPVDVAAMARTLDVEIVVVVIVIVVVPVAAAAEVIGIDEAVAAALFDSAPGAFAVPDVDALTALQHVAD